MNYYFIMPVTMASINNQTVNVPQHFTDILQPNGVTWSLPFGDWIMRASCLRMIQPP
jgi:hypothetical protein